MAVAAVNEHISVKQAQPRACTCSTFSKIIKIFTLHFIIPLSKCQNFSENHLLSIKHEEQLIICCFNWLELCFQGTLREKVKRFSLLKM